MPRPSAPVGQRHGAAREHERHPGPGPRPVLRRLPAARLTGLGSGLLTTLAMLAAGYLDSLVGGSPRLYGGCFLLAAAACALWVRPVDLMTAPVSVPIAYAVGAIPLSDASGGFVGRVMSLVTMLSLSAAWLYSGTLLAGLIALCRRIALIRVRRRERRQQRQQPSRPPRSPRCSADGRGRPRR
ncbi:MULTISPECIES: DUF6542 domain-containing protein [Streptomyces]|uniref:DUF6542 domain-containing protein n=1 Tax=Streptomyces luteosporeus TaxID=173856 RepID=A0ABP6GA51_9ACTN